MDLNESMDIYCERTNASFWAEPFNAISNVAFIIAALLALMMYIRYLKKGAKKDVHILILIALGFTVGVCSFIFHTFATRWAHIVDLIPIYLFTIYYTLVAMWKIIKFNRLQTTISLILIIMMVLLMSILIPNEYFNRSAGYFPLAIMLAAFGVYFLYKKHPAAKFFLLAAGVFIMALIFRTIDMMCCSWNPIGTHFLWHISNGILLYILLRILILTQVDEEKYSI